MTEIQLQKEIKLNQKALSIWFMGLSGAGKTTLANALEAYLLEKGFISVVQDADRVRQALNKELGYSVEDRKENIRRVAEVSKLLILNGLISINAFICPTEDIRDQIVQIIDKEKLVFIYLSTPMEVCEQRDIKGMYNKARNGELSNFTGIGAKFEVPLKAHLIIDTSKTSIVACIDTIFQKIESKIRLT